MGAVNVYDAKTHFSRLLRRVRAGEEIVIAAAGRPVARLVPIGTDTGPRVLGGDEGEVWISEDFNAPLPDAIVAAFYGTGANKTHARARSRRRVRSRTRTGGRR